jgi:purine nucleoside permease
MAVDDEIATARKDFAANAAKEPPSVTKSPSANGYDNVQRPWRLNPAGPKLIDWAK